MNRDKYWRKIVLDMGCLYDEGLDDYVPLESIKDGFKLPYIDLTEKQKTF